jgi:hypothetical protein
MKKIFIIFLLILIIPLFFYIKEKKLNNKLAVTINDYKEVVNDYKEVVNDYKEADIKKNYNVKYLPETQFVNLQFVEKKIILNDIFLEKLSKSKWSKHTFYFDEYENKLIVVDYFGNIYFFDKNRIIDEKTLINLKPIKSNLKTNKVLDIKIIDQNIYISHFIKKNDCQYFSIFVGKINLDTIFFQDFFTDKTCAKFLQGGRMVDYTHNNNRGILISTSDQFPDDTDMLNPPPQNNDNIFGKILFFDFKKKKNIIFSKGHRNIQGLYSEDDLILATEHGPRGGDEINKIIFGKNYGWPISSYGEKYTEMSENINYYKNHKKYKFQEPIYAYVPSIGISEIIRLGNNFSKFFQNNFIVSSLASGHIYRIKFDENFNKIIFQEKIFIGKRIRDLKYLEDYKTILVGLEDDLTSSIGVITTN